MRTYAETVAQWNEISLNEVKGKVTFKPNSIMKGDGHERTDLLGL
jgi:hypothetical protein